jgi:hypothetical protein
VNALRSSLFGAALALAAALLVSSIPPAAAQTPSGLGLCSTDPPAALSVSVTSSNVQLGSCGPTVIVYNITSQEAFYKVGSSSSVTAAVTGNPLPGNTFVVLNVPTGRAAYWFAAITSSSTTTLQFVQGTGH